MKKYKVECMNCDGKVEFDLEYKKQIVTCEKCGKQMSIRPYKNGRLWIHNLSV